MVSSSINAKLTKPYTREEVDIAIKNMAPMTASAPMGCLLSSTGLFGWILV